jgi:hypothetical protein
VEKGEPLLDDMRRTFGHLEKHPEDSPLTEDKAGSNNHTGQQTG